MVRSTGLPTSRGLNGLSRVIRARANAQTIARVSTTTGSLDEQQSSESEHSESVWLFEPRETSMDELAGEELSGSLGGLAVADGSVDLQHEDRVTHGGVEYEVDTIVGHPEDGDADGSASPDTDFWVIDFERRQ